MKKFILFARCARHTWVTKSVRRQHCYDLLYQQLFGLRRNKPVSIRYAF